MIHHLNKLLISLLGLLTPLSGICQKTVIDYGADSSGKYNSTQAIQAAFNDPNQKNVIFLPGKYLVDPLLLTKDGKNIIGNGANLILDTSYHSEPADIITIMDADSIMINDINLYGNIQGQNTEFNMGISIRAANGNHNTVTLENLSVHDMHGDGIYLGVPNHSLTTNFYSNILLKNLAIHNCYRNGIGIVEGSNVKIDSVNIDSCGLSSVEFEPNYPTTIRNVQIINSNVGAVGCGSLFNYIENFTVTNTTIDIKKGYGSYPAYPVSSNGQLYALLLRGIENALFDSCKIYNAGLSVLLSPTPGFQNINLRFQNCIFDSIGTNINAIRMFDIAAGDTIHFYNCIFNNNDKHWIFTGGDLYFDDCVINNGNRFSSTLGKVNFNRCIVNAPQMTMAYYSSDSMNIFNSELNVHLLAASSHFVRADNSSIKTNADHLIVNSHGFLKKSSINGHYKMVDRDNMDIVKNFGYIFLVTPEGQSANLILDSLPTLTKGWSVIMYDSSGTARSKHFNIYAQDSGNVKINGLDKYVIDSKHEAVEVWSDGENYFAKEVTFDLESFEKYDTSSVMADFSLLKDTGCDSLKITAISKSHTNNGYIKEQYWFLNGVEIGDSDSLYYDLDSVGSYFLKLIVKTNHGLSDSTEKQIVIHRFPIVNLGRDRSICNGDILDSFEGSGESNTYEWNTGDTTRILAIVSSGQYSVMVTNAYGCISGDTVNITVNPTPVINLVSDTSICKDQPLKIGDDNLKGSKFLWNTGETSSEINIGSSGKYWVKETNSYGCWDIDSINVRVDSAQVNLGNDTSLCKGKFLMLDAGNPGAKYLWSTGDTTQRIKAHNSGIYSVKVAKCGLNVSDTIVVKVDSLSSTIANEDGTLVTKSSYEHYQWYKDGEILSGETNRFLAIKDTGIFSVTVLDTEGCQCKSNELRVNELPKGKSFLNKDNLKIFPNPTLGKIYINMANPTKDNIFVKVVNSKGKRIFAGQFSYMPYTIDLSNQQSGYYSIILIYKSEKFVSKILLL